jgi:hypothetical protein
VAIRLQKSPLLLRRRGIVYFFWPVTVAGVAGRGTGTGGKGGLSITLVGAALFWPGVRLGARDDGFLSIKIFLVVGLRDYSTAFDA